MVILQCPFYFLPCFAPQPSRLTFPPLKPSPSSPQTIYPDLKCTKLRPNLIRSRKMGAPPLGGCSLLHPPLTPALNHLPGKVSGYSFTDSEGSADVVPEIYPAMMLPLSCGDAAADESPSVQRQPNQRPHPSNHILLVAWAQKILLVGHDPASSPSKLSLSNAVYFSSEFRVLFAGHISFSWLFSTTGLAHLHYCLMMVLTQDLFVEFSIESLWDFSRSFCTAELCEYSPIILPLDVYNTNSQSLPDSFRKPVLCSYSIHLRSPTPSLSLCLPHPKPKPFLLRLVYMNYLLLNCRCLSCRLLQFLLIAIPLGPNSSSFIPWHVYRCFCVARSVFGLEECTTDDSFSVLFKGSMLISIAVLKIVIFALVAVSITGISSLVVFLISHGIIPLLRRQVVETRGPLHNVSCLRIMTASILCFYVLRLLFVAALLVVLVALVLLFVNYFSSVGE